MICFDSNILVYSIDHDAGPRHHRAADLVERAIRGRSCSQPLQTLCEFFHVTTRKIGLDPKAASVFIEDWQCVTPVEPADVGDLEDAMRAIIEHGLSFWDAMLWATARRIGVRLLISEDLQDGRILEGVRIVNPFVHDNTALIDREIGRW